MELFGTNYLNIRNIHLLPRLNYGIKRKKIEYWSLKEILTTKLISLNKLNGKSIEIEMSKDDYYKSIHCDIELFMNKSIIQYSDFVNQKEISKSWSFVTFYYFSFFTITCLFRFLNKGFLFFSSEQIRRFEQFSLAVYSNPISLSTGNYYFSLKEINAYGNVVIVLSEKGDSVHKSTWLQLEATLRDFLKNCDSDEAILYNLLLNHFTKFKSEYPSNLRNKLNYNGESSILDLNDNIPIVKLQKIDQKFFSDLAKIDFNSIDNANQMNSISFLASYFFEFNQKLYKEYLERSKFGKDFSAERDDYLKTKKVKF
jgi:hypothetical protein